MNPSHDHTAPPEGTPPKADQRWRRVLRRVAAGVGIAIGVVCLLTIIVTVCLRLYYNDGRLRQMAQAQLGERLHTTVEIDDLSISLFSGIELGPLRIGPMAGFEHDTVAFQRLAIHWSTLNLLRLRVVIPEIALEGIELVIEENDQGRSLDALIRALRPPAAQSEPEPELELEPEPEPEPTQDKSLEQPSLPVFVELQRLGVSVRSFRMIKPDLDFAIDNVGVEAEFVGKGQWMELDLWMGLGDRPIEQDPDSDGPVLGTLGQPSRLSLSGTAVPGHAKVEQRLGIAIKSGGLGNIEVGLDWLAEAVVEGKQNFPPVRASSVIDLEADLLKQSATLSRFFIGVGDKTRVEVAANVEKMLTAPTITVDTFEIGSDFNELEPLVAAFVSGLKLSGGLSMSAEPFVLPANKNAAAHTVANVTLVLTDVGVELQDIDVDDFNIRVQLTSADAEVKVALQTDAGSVRAAGQLMDDLKVELNLRAPLGPWLGGAVTGDIDTSLNARAIGARGSWGQVSGLRLDLDVSTPAAWVDDLVMKKSKSTTDPLVANLRVAVANIATPKAKVAGLELHLGASAWDMTGERVDAKLTTSLPLVTVLPGPGAVDLTETALLLVFSRSGQRLDLEKLQLSTSEALLMQGSGSVDRIFGSAPRFDDFKFKVAISDLERALTLAPQNSRPQLAISGKTELHLRIDGVVPHKKLSQQAVPPQVDSEDMAVRLTALADYLNNWEAAFRVGMPFVASIDLHLIGVDLELPQARISGLGLDFGIAVEKHGPVVTLTTIMDELQKPVVAKGLRNDLSLSFTDGAIKLGFSSELEELQQKPLAQPVKNASANMAFTYRLGGDLSLDNFGVRAPEPGLNFDASGVIAKPLQFVLTQGWTKPRMPGLTAALRWNAGLFLADELSALTQGGPELSGAASISGNVRAEDGSIAFAGSLTTKELNFRKQEIVGSETRTTLLEDMSGSLPFDVEFAFDPRDDATILRRDLNVGSGVFALVTAADDVRKRPARPAFYDRLRPYRQNAGLTARRIIAGPINIDDFELEGRITRGMLLVDWLAMHILGGDINGNMALQIGRDASARADFGLKVSNLDASYFEALNLQPGPDSELNADMQLSFLAAPVGRDLTMYMNVTKIGSKTLERFLLLLDPSGQMGAQLWLVKIDEVRTWIKFENLNMDLDVSTIIRIPGTNIGYPNVDRELLRGFPLAGYLDAFAQPQIDKSIAPLLGWNHAE